VKLVSWNVNSIRAREARTLTWLKQHRPDVVCMQEIKVVNDAFPTEAFRDAGYEIELHGQKSYNGVAIASRLPMTDVVRGFGDDEADEHARLIAATIEGVRVVDVYVPNGQAPGTDKYEYKLAWFGRLRRWLDRTCDPAAPLILCGDFNVAPEDRDVHDPAVWKDQIMCSDAERAALREVVAWGPGLVDVFRDHHQETDLFSWWDYRGVALFKNKGLRIDHLWVTPALATRCTACDIDKQARKGQDASDHAPVIGTFELGRAPGEG
jgi:exodeoxyribonuclease-3